MSRTRLIVAGAILVLFIAVGGVLIYSSQHRGGTPRTFNVSVKAATSMTPNVLEPVHVGDTVTINVTSDRSGEVHLHVYEIAFDPVAGQTVSHTFKADKTCTCDIEWESTSTPLGSLVVSP